MTTMRNTIIVLIYSICVLHMQSQPERVRYTHTLVVQDPSATEEFLPLFVRRNQAPISMGSDLVYIDHDGIEINLCRFDSAVLAVSSNPLADVLYISTLSGLKQFKITFNNGAYDLECVREYDIGSNRIATQIFESNGNVFAILRVFDITKENGVGKQTIDGVDWTIITSPRWIVLLPKDASKHVDLLSEEDSLVTLWYSECDRRLNLVDSDDRVYRHLDGDTTDQPRNLNNNAGLALGPSGILGYLCDEKTGDQACVFFGKTNLDMQWWEESLYIGANMVLEGDRVDISNQIFVHGNSLWVTDDNGIVSEYRLVDGRIVEESTSVKNTVMARVVPYVNDNGKSNIAIIFLLNIDEIYDVLVILGKQ